MFPIVINCQIFEGTFQVQGYHSAIDNDNNIIVVGDFQGTIDFDPGPNEELLVALEERDVFISKYSSNSKLIWVKQLIGDAYAYAESVKTDSSGNIFIVGNFHGTIDMDPSENVKNFHVDGWNEDIFIAKYNSNGDFEWATQLGGPSIDDGINLVVDGNNDLYATISFEAEIDADPSEQTEMFYSNGFGVLLTKYSNNGEYLWAKKICESVLEMPMAVDKGNNIYLAKAYKEDSIYFNENDTNSLVTGKYNLFIVKFNSFGDFIWVRNIKCGIDIPYRSDVRDIEVDQEYNLFLTGEFKNTLLFESSDTSILLESNGLEDFYITKMDTDGNYIWAKQYGSKDEDYSNYLELDSHGNIYLAGVYYADIEELKLEKHDFHISNQYLMKISNDGELNWTTGFQYPSRFNDLLVNKTDTIYTIGRLFDFDPSVNEYSVYSSITYPYYLSKFSQSNVSRNNSDLLLNDTIYANNSDESNVVNNIFLELQDSCMLNYQEEIDFFYVESYFQIDSLIEIGWLIVQDNSFHRFLTYRDTSSDLSIGNTKFTLNINCSLAELSNTFITYGFLTSNMVYSVPTNKASDFITVYPNPTSNLIYIRNALGSDIKIFNTTGQLICSKKGIKELETINLSGFPPGPYFVQIIQNNNTISKIIIRY